MMCWLPKAAEFFYHISPDVIAIILGGFIFQRWFTKRANQAELINILIHEFDRLRDDALEYWNLNGENPEELRRAKILEQKIKATAKALAADLRNYESRYKTKMDHATLMSEVIDTCTGGTFEAKDRKPDVSRYIFIANSIGHVKTTLMGHKL